MRIRTTGQGTNWWAPLALGGAWLCSAPAFAQGTDVGAAELLFRQGRELLDAGKVAEACPKFAESFRLDAGTGTLLGLAMCHEQEGKLASAWAEYLEVQGRAQREGDAQRAEFSRQKSGALEPRLSTLSIDVPAEVAALPALEIKRNGVPVGRGSWSVAVPLDGGDYVVEAQAPGKKAWTQTVELHTEATRGRVEVPPLVDAPPETALTPEAAPPPGEPVTADRGTSSSPFGEMNTVRWAGVGAAGAGVVSLGLGGYFLATALGQHSDSESECENDGLCTERGTDLRADSVGNGNLATVFGIAGLALVGTGAVLFFVVGPEDTGAAGGSGFTVAATALPAGAGATVSGRF